MREANRQPRTGSWLWWVVLLAALLGLARWPVTTRVGVNYQWSERRIPLHEKVVNFFSRDLQTRRLVRETTAGASDEEEKLLRLFAWVTTAIRPTPEGFPVVDDHIFHIIVRGYGTEDQRTEAFVTLAGYAGFQASVARLQAPSGAAEGFVFLALVKGRTKTYVFDVNNRMMFTDEHGRLADVEQLRRHPQLVIDAAQGLAIRGIPYQHYLQGLDHAKVFSRAPAQQFWPRMRQELQQLLRVQRR